MRNPFILCLLVCLLILNIIACGEKAILPEQAGFGPHPTLPPPNPTLKIYAGAPHGLAYTHKDQLNADLLAFLKT